VEDRSDAAALLRRLFRHASAFTRRLLVLWLLRPLATTLGLGLRWFVSKRARVVAVLAMILLCGLALVAFAAASPATAQTVTLKARHHNMYWADITLNDRLTLRAMIDTGATSLSMYYATAKAHRLTLGDVVKHSTANGVITARRAMIPFQSDDQAASRESEQARAAACA
jgi:hypothetical protein